MAVLSETDIRVAPYFIARALHAVLAAILTFVFWQPLVKVSTWFLEKSVPVFMPTTAGIPVTSWWETIAFSGTLAVGVAVLLLAISLLARYVLSGKTR
ncbi:hypothetical protein D478_20619 [Brevibacillus agri BAB-2500]|nr:hypothetical protein D478_20619 [Brevibacillus agri BAB-2500]